MSELLNLFFSASQTLACVPKNHLGNLFKNADNKVLPLESYLVGSSVVIRTILRNLISGLELGGTQGTQFKEALTLRLAWVPGWHLCKPQSKCLLKYCMQGILLHSAKPTWSTPWSCMPQVVHGPAAPAWSGALLEMQTLRPTPDPLNQKLHFARGSGYSHAHWSLRNHEQKGMPK